MHTFNTKSGRTIQFNQDCSGLAQIVMLDGERVQLPCEELIDFVAMLVRVERIALAEGGDDAEEKIAALLRLSSKQVLGLSHTPERSDAIAFMRELLIDCQKKFNHAGSLVCEYVMGAFERGEHEGASKK